MKTAIITGASSGLGRIFAEKVKDYFPEVERVWLIARREERLRELADRMNVECDILPLDLTKNDDIEKLSSKLVDEGPNVRVLVNCAGCGYLGNVDEIEPKLLARMIDLNIRAVTLVAAEVTPYMHFGSCVINLSSIASFCPNARMTVYSASKSYVSAFSLGLRDELRSRKISVTAVQPGPMDTEFIVLGHIKGNSEMFNKLPYCDPVKVVDGSYKAAKADRAFYTPTAFYKLYRGISKILPRTIMVKFART